MELLHVKDLTAVTGYVRGGCTPIGMKKQFATFADSSALGFETIFFSAGKIGAQVEVAPEDLKELTGCSFKELV